MVSAAETSQSLSSNSTPCCSSKVLMKPFTMFTLPSARWLLCFFPSSGCSKMVMLPFSPQPPNLLGKSENGWLVVTLQGDCLTAPPIRPIRHKLRNPWCSIALSRNCHRQSEPILRLSSYEDRVALLICLNIKVTRLEKSVVNSEVWTIS